MLPPRPRRGTVTMSVVQSLEEERNVAKVMLMESKRKGTLIFSDQDREEIKVGRMVAVVVRSVRVRFRRKSKKNTSLLRLFQRKMKISDCDSSRARVSDICCTLEGLTPEIKNMCDVAYTESLHVEEILTHAARNTNVSLKRLYELTKWPSLADLRNNNSALWNYELDVDIRNQLRSSVQTIWYESFRLAHNTNRCLSSSRLNQKKAGYCYAIALIRYYEYLLKMKGRLAVDLSLSIQDFINNLPAGMEDAKFHQYKYVVKTLENQGVLLEKDGGSLTFIRVPPVERSAGMRIYSPYHLEYRGLTQNNWKTWNSDINIRLKYGPVAASFIWFRSYDDNPVNPGDVLRPTPHEEAEYIAHPKARYPMHSGMITGCGVDSYGNEFWEVLDSYGDVGNGDRGYLRLAVTFDPIYVIDYAEIQLDEDDP